MLQISFFLDGEFEPTATNPHGDLAIRNGGQEIVIRSTYLDTWFAALADACRRLASVREVKWEIGEPGALIVACLPDSSVDLRFGGQHVSVDSLASLESEVGRVTGQFLEELKVLPDFDESYFPRMVKSFADWQFE